MTTIALELEEEEELYLLVCAFAYMCTVYTDLCFVATFAAHTTYGDGADNKGANNLLELESSADNLLDLRHSAVWTVYNNGVNNEDNDDGQWRCT